MEMMAVDPLAFVVAPRFLAGVIAMPILACVFNGLGILGRNRSTSARRRLRSN